MFDFKGTINLVTDLNVALQYSYNQDCTILFIGELNRAVSNNQSIIDYPALLPPYEAINAEINGDMNKYYEIYNSYLMTNPTCFQAIMSIIVAAYCGKNIIMYIEEGNELSHAQALLNFFAMTYGISIGTMNTQFMININFVPQMAVLLYSFLDGFMTLEDMLCSINDISVITMMENNPFIFPLEKIAAENNMSGVDPNLLINWITEYRNKLINIITPVNCTRIINWNKKPNNDNKKVSKKKGSKKKC